MNPSSNEAGMQLPSPVPEQAPAAMQPEAMPPQAEQGLPAIPEQAPASYNQPAPLMAMPMPPLEAQPSPQPAVPPTTPIAAVPLADDGDLIEKEWVHKAKQIVDQNRDDPYKQSEELTVFKAGYMKQRYNKTIKLNK